ncbi:cell surface protein [Mucilaginibacter conchicola]|uniref:Cell surface protein n=1 Tax=Mucilaginibacter conchicola TaxID=2303333 RepID=A0A372NW33_9SPHI|nr:cell surface protein [Mucilaginibacter conchicola]RFZ94316.1 cell surface protein [Mucilaginibacter conchicola]
MKKQFTLSKHLIIASLALGVLWQSCSKDKIEVIQEAPIRPITANSNAYVTDLFEFNPAPGQFINTDLGDEKGAKGTLGSNNGLVSLGAWGGNIVVGFDHTVLDAAGKTDLVVYGNGFANFAEPGVIWVMADTNGNGKPDDKWYEIKGSAYGQPGYIRDYEVTYTKPACDTCSVHWADNQGKTGVVQTNMFHTQAYYPASVTTNTYTLKGTLLPSTNIDMSNPTYITSAAFDYGYSDNKAGGDEIDISTAVDEKGNKANLKGIDFIKVQTGIQANMGWLGEQSTEFTGAADLSLLK